jgi:hypothetical protein
MSQTTPTSLEWIDREAALGPVFRLAGDVGHRDAERCLRVCAQATPDAAYRSIFQDVVAQLVVQWGGSIELILDFQGHGPSGPGEAVHMCRSLGSSGHVNKITLIQKPWMPATLVSAVLSLLRVSGTPIFVEKSP